MRRLERVINLLTALLETERPLTRAELAERVPGYDGDEGSARRTFERDKEVLRDMGLPLISEALDADHPEDGFGYRVPKDAYQLPDPGLTKDEMAALALAASAVRLESQAATAALWKLGATPDANVHHDIDLSNSEQLACFFTARRERRTVDFTYNAKIRKLDPHRLAFRNGRWYVSGFDHEHDDQRIYRLDRVTGDVTVSEPKAFDVPTQAAQPWLLPWQMGDGTPIQVSVLVDGELAGLATRQTGERAVEQVNDDGSVVLSLDVVNVDALRSFVIDFGEQAEVLGPPDVREGFASYLLEIVETPG